MKTARKVLLIALCAVLLVSASVMGTLAYLTSKDAVTNTFTVGKVGITLDELDVDNSTAGDNDRDKANAYKLIPGTTYTKDPTIHVASDSENCYLFVKIENGISAIEGDKTVAAQMAAKGWSAVEGQTGIYVYTKDGKNAVVTAGTDVVVFDNFTVRGSVDNATLNGYQGKTIVVTAYAIQVEGFENKTAAEIWTAADFT